jgi:hypothetical protein
MTTIVLQGLLFWFQHAHRQSPRRPSTPIVNPFLVHQFDEKVFSLIL